MEDEREYDNRVTRNEAATTLRDLADGVDAGSIRFDIEAEPVAVSVPDELELELELEREGGEIEVEVELEWRDSDGELTLEEGTLQSEPDSEDEADEEETEMRPLVGAADPRESLARFEVFRDRADEWRWRLVHRNGNIIATSGEGYTQKHNAKKGLQSVVNNAPEAEIGDESGFE